MTVLQNTRFGTVYAVHTTEIHTHPTPVQEQVPGRANAKTTAGEHTGTSVYCFLYAVSYIPNVQWAEINMGTFCVAFF